MRKKIVRCLLNLCLREHVIFFYEDYDYMHDGEEFGNNTFANLDNLLDDDLLSCYFIKAFIYYDVETKVLKNCDFIIAVLNKVQKMYCGFKSKDISKIICQYYITALHNHDYLNKISEYENLVANIKNKSDKINLLNFIGITEEFEINY